MVKLTGSSISYYKNKYPGPADKPDNTARPAPPFASCSRSKKHEVTSIARLCPVVQARPSLLC